MVLNFGTIGGIFPQSSELGVGLNPNPTVQIKIDAGEGIIIFSKSGRGSTTSSTEVQLDSIKFAAGDLRVGDLINIRFFTDTPSGTAQAKLFLKKDSTTILEIQQIGNNQAEFAEVNIAEDLTDNTFAIVSKIQFNQQTTNELMQTSQTDVTTANWFIGEWTLNLRGNNGTGTEEFFWNWSVTIIKGAR